MRYRSLGATGLDISEIVFGAGAVGGVVFQTEPQTRLQAVRRALEHGINWIDTAPGYGDGQSEENLGWILEELDASPYLSTKVRIAPEQARDIPGEVQRSMEASLKRLRRDSVDLIQLHNPVTSERGDMRGSLSIDDVMGDHGVASAFARLIDQGMTRFSGFTGSGDTDCLHRMVRSGAFHTVQAYYNMLNPSAGRAVPAGFPGPDYRDLIGVATQHGVGVLNIRVLAAGAIAGAEANRVAGGWPPGVGPEEDVRRGVRLREALGDEPGTPAQAAIRFALMNPGVSGVLVGFSNLEHIDEAVAAVDMGPLSDDTLDRLEQLYATDFAA